MTSCPASRVDLKECIKCTGNWWISMG